MAQIADAPATRPGWRLVALLAAFSLVSYALRTNISIAAALMRTELHLSTADVGRLFSAFLIGYAAFQVPVGALGDRFGPRLVLTAAAIIWGVLTAMTGALPGMVGGAGATLAVLLAVRFLLGVAEAATYPVAALAVGTWMPPSERAFANALVIAGMAVGSASVPPLVSRVMVASGWRAAFYVTAVPAFLIAALWWWSVARMTTPSRQATPATGGARAAIHWPLLRNRNMILISASYFLDSYVLAMFVYWFYLYLVDERGFSVLASGTFSSLPWIAALVLVPTAGWWCDRLSARRGARLGRRVVAMTALAVSSMLLWWGARAAHAGVAIAALSLSVGCLMSTEGPFWSSAIDVSGGYAGTAGGIMNTAGNLGGVAQASMVPLLVERVGWIPALATGSVLALASAALWLLIRVDE